jgi:hypothetical protein
MADVWVVLATVAFFGLCVALVWGCDKIIGPDDASDLREVDEVGEVEERAAEVVAR